MKQVELTNRFLILWMSGFTALYCLAGDPNALFEQWRSEFRVFRESKGKDSGVSYSTDFDKIRNFESYKALVKSTLPNIEDLMLAEMGAYPYTPERLYLAFAFCERRSWDWKQTAKEYGPAKGKFGLPDAIRKRLAHTVSPTTKKANRAEQDEALKP